MSSNFNFKDDKILKPITILTLLYSALMFIKYIGNIVGLLFSSHSPLMPEYLHNYVAFPSYVLVPFFAILIFLCIRTLSTKLYNAKLVYVLFGLALLFYMFQWQIYQWILSFNPYNS
jgi:hypothetical protein